MASSVSSSHSLKIAFTPESLENLRQQTYIEDLTISCTRENAELWPNTYCQLDSIGKTIQNHTKLTKLALCGLGTDSRKDNENIEILTHRIDHLPLKSLTISNGFFYSLKGIASLEALESIDVTTGYLQHLPSEIDSLVFLKILRLKNTSIQELPNEIGNLRSLEVLDMSGSQILRGLPASLGDLNNLRILSLNTCHLNVMPTCITNLIGLEILELRGNGLEIIPEEISVLLKLHTLNISGNPLKAFESVGKLSSLTNLNLEGCELKGLPESFSGLKNLVTLNLRHNCFSEFPAQLVSLIKLDEINLSENDLEYITPEISQLVSLRTFYLHSNSLTKLPKELGSLANLEKLTLGRNPIQEAEQGTLQSNLLQLLNFGISTLKPFGLPDELRGLKNLNWLDLNYVGLTTLPDFLNALTNLRHLTLVGNKLSNALLSPVAFAELTKLEELDITRMDINTIPPCISYLPNLKLLHLGYPPICGWGTSKQTGQPRVDTVIKWNYPVA